MCYGRESAYDLVYSGYSNHENAIYEENRVTVTERYGNDGEKLSLALEYIGQARDKGARDYAVTNSYLEDVVNKIVTPEDGATLASTYLMSPRAESSNLHTSPQMRSYYRAPRDAQNLADWARIAGEELGRKNRRSIDEYSSKEELIAFADKRDKTLSAVSNYVTAVRQQTQQQSFQVAERWSHKPNITVAQACHGVAWELTKKFGERVAYENGQVTSVDPGQEYAQLYDTNKADAITSGAMPSAADLFD